MARARRKGDAARRARAPQRARPAKAPLRRRQGQEQVPASWLPSHAFTPRTDWDAEECTQLLAAAPVAWLLLDLNAVIVDVNVAGCRILDRSRRLLVGTPLRLWMSEQSHDELDRHVQFSRGGAERIETELRIDHPSGGPSPAVRLLSRRVVLRGRTLFSSVLIDTSELLMAERSRQDAERRRAQAETQRRLAASAEAAKDRLIAMVSHELRNPLSPVLMAASALSAAPGLPDSARNMVAIIQRNVEIEARLIDDLLDVARVTRGKLDLRMRPHDLHTILTHAVAACSAVADAERVRIVLDFQAERHQVHADDARMQQVFWNLLNNAIKFSEPGGQVLVRTASDESGVLRVTVRDYGRGMEVETLSHLFSPFAQPTAPGSRRAGLGLGLSIARGIIEAHGGHIWATSDGPGRGSTFEVELATTTDADARPQTAPLAAPGTHESPRRPAPGRRVLLVEDHEDTISMLATLLARLGYEVTEARTLAEAEPRLSEGWEIVVSDIGLPDGSGLDIARRLRADGHPPRIMIAVSGHGRPTDVAASLDAGFDAHLVKPVSLTRLLGTIDRRATQA